MVRKLVMKFIFQGFKQYLRKNIKFASSPSLNIFFRTDIIVSLNFILPDRNGLTECQNYLSMISFVETCKICFSVFSQM